MITTSSPRIRFSYPIGVLAVIEGTVKLEAGRLLFELTMTESVTGPVKSVIKRDLDLSELESVELKRRLFRKSTMDFTAHGLEAFRDFPGSRGCKFSVIVEGPHKLAFSFVRDVLFEMTEIETASLNRRFQDTQKSPSAEVLRN